MAEEKPDQTNEGLRFDGHRIPLISWVASWFTKSGDGIRIVDLIAIAVIAGVVVFLLAHDGSSGSSGAEGGGSLPTSEGSESGPAGGSTVVEYSDNHAGSPVFANPRGAPVEGGRSGSIPYETEVVVSCFAENQSEMESVSGFYRIASGEWEGDYVVADTMTNGGPIGNTDSPNVDPRVRPCESGG